MDLNACGRAIAYFSICALSLEDRLDGRIAKDDTRSEEAIYDGSKYLYWGPDTY
jgi:hypothetical protein